MADYETAPHQPACDEHRWKFNGGNPVCADCGTYKDAYVQRVFTATISDSVPAEKYTPSPALACIVHNSTQHPRSEDYAFCYRKYLFGNSHPTPCRFVQTYFKESDR